MRSADRGGAAQGPSERSSLHQLQEGRGASLSRLSANRLVFISVAVVVVLLDQLTKALALAYLGSGRRIALIGDFLGLELVRNPGGAFGVFPSGTVVFFFASLVIVIVVGYKVMREGIMPVPLGLVMGGGVGNLIDRIFRPPGPLRGHVIDFIQSSVWPTFNLADSAIVAGVVLVLISGLQTKHDEAEPSER